MSRTPPEFTAASAAAWLRSFLPARMALDARERVRIVVGAALGILLTGLLTRLVGPAALPWLIAPLGASAVLVFGVPGSPLAQPWSVVGGNTVSALAGIVCVHAFGAGPMVVALAVGLAIAAMLALRCLHPPGGACALVTSLGGIADPSFVIAPVLLNSVVLVAVGIAYNSATGKRYPHAQQPVPAAPAATPMPSFTAADLDAAIARHNQVLDIGRDELEGLLGEAERQAYRRKMGAIQCRDIMARDPVRAEIDMPLQEAWSLLRSRGFKMLPVVDGDAHVIGVVTLADFLRGADLDAHAGWPARLRALLRAPPAPRSGAGAVGQIMTRAAHVVRADRPINELVPVFASTGHHHLPIVDADHRLVGIITQSDLVAALSRG